LLSFFNNIEFANDYNNWYSFTLPDNIKFKYSLEFMACTKKTLLTPELLDSLLLIIRKNNASECFLNLLNQFAGKEVWLEIKPINNPKEYKSHYLNLSKFVMNSSINAEFYDSIKNIFTHPNSIVNWRYKQKPIIQYFTSLYSTFDGIPFLYSPEKFKYFMDIYLTYCQKKIDVNQYILLCNNINSSSSSNININHNNIINLINFFSYNFSSRDINLIIDKHFDSSLSFKQIEDDFIKDDLFILENDLLRQLFYLENKQIKVSDIFNTSIEDFFELINRTNISINDKSNVLELYFKYIYYKKIFFSIYGYAY